MGCLNTHGQGSWRRLGLGALGAMALPLWAATPPTAAACSARSGPVQAALVELYTSEGCSSCPPADAALSRLAPVDGAAATVVALSLHVPYWDSIGWKDPYGQPAFAARQRWLVAANQAQTVFTPHYFVNGRQALDWRSELAPALKAAAARVPQATLALRTQPSAQALSVQAEVAPAPGAQAASDWQLYVAVTENHLVSAVDAGENRGATLRHDHVVRQWLGPYAVPAAGGTVSREVALDARWQRAQLGVTAFVQRASTGEVLQALALPLCGAGAPRTP